jgi:hypothetical protein
MVWGWRGSLEAGGRSVVGWFLPCRQHVKLAWIEFVNYTTMVHGVCKLHVLKGGKAIQMPQVKVSIRSGRISTLAYEILVIMHEAIGQSNSTFVYARLPKV